MTNKSASLRDVAKAAGVGLATASRAMNHDINIKRDTFDRVHAAAKKLGYKFPEMERRPVRGNAVIQEKNLKHGRIALLYSDRNSEGFKTEMSRELCSGIQDYLFDRRIEFLQTNFGEDGSLPECIKQKNIDGFIMRGNIPQEITSEKNKAILKRFPHIAALWHDPEDNIDSVLTDTELLGRNTVRMFAARKRKNIVILSAFEQRTDFSAATYGFQKEAEIFPLNAQAVVRQFDHIKPEMDKCRKIIANLAKSPQKIDGILLNGGEDSWIEILKEKGMVPVKNLDIVIGSWTMKSAEPLLKENYIVNLGHPNDVGKAAAEQLLWRISNPNALQRRIMIPPEIILPKNK